MIRPWWGIPSRTGRRVKRCGDDLGTQIEVSTMQAINKMNNWTNAHDRGYLVDVLRVCFGIYLIIKAVQFGRDASAITGYANLGSEFFVPVLLSHAVIITHISGGILLLVGLLTRLVMVILLPIFLGAVVLGSVADVPTMYLVEAVISLILCFTFLTLGSGKGSVDKNLHMHI